MPRQSARLQRKRGSQGASVGGSAKRRSRAPAEPELQIEPQREVVTPHPTTSDVSLPDIPDAMLANIIPNNTAIAEQPITPIHHEIIPPGQASGEPLQPFMSVGLSIDARVSNKTRQKIWDREYIDLGILFENPTKQGRYQLTVNNAVTEHSPSLVLEPADKPRKITSIDSWLTAFNVYVGIYTMKFASEAPALAKYISTIRDLAERGHNWQFYDENFRFLRQSHVSSMPWGCIHSELWLRSHVTSTASRPNTSRSRDDSIPQGFCFRFHRGNTCQPNCRFKHKCFRCNGAHRVGDCTFRYPRTNGRDKQLQSQKATAQPKTAYSGASR